MLPAEMMVNVLPLYIKSLGSVTPAVALLLAIVPDEVELLDVAPLKRSGLALIVPL